MRVAGATRAQAIAVMMPAAPAPTMATSVVADTGGPTINRPRPAINYDVRMRLPLRWGLLGTARINRLLIPALRASTRSEPVAVASREAARAAAYAREWRIPLAYGSYDALLASDLDIVFVPLPNSLHVPWALRALEAGRHVLCEKPMALEAADIDRLADAARTTGCIITEGFTYRHHPQTQRVVELVRSGALGQVRAVLGTYCYTQSRPHDVRLDPALGGGVLHDIGCYPVSYGQLLAGGAPDTVTAMARVGPTGVDEDIAGTISYAGDTVLQFFASFRAPWETRLRIIGETGTIDLPRPFRPEPVEQIEIRRQNTVEHETVEGGGIFDGEVADMEDAVLGLHPPRVTLDDSRTLTATLAALHRAARNGGQVPVVTPVSRAPGPA